MPRAGKGVKSLSKHLTAPDSDKKNCVATLQLQPNGITCLAFSLGPVEIHTWFIIHAVHTNEHCAN